jgi:hypothetical protein
VWLTSLLDLRGARVDRRGTTAAGGVVAALILGLDAPS